MSVRTHTIAVSAVLLLALTGCTADAEPEFAEGPPPATETTTEEEAAPTIQELDGPATKAELDGIWAEADEEARTGLCSEWATDPEGTQAEVVETTNPDGTTVLRDAQGVTEWLAATCAALQAAMGTVAQQNAYESALSYLENLDFSRAELLNQLEYEQFSPADAEFAVARIEAEGKVDWMAEAVESATSYLEYSAFSRGELIDQLLYEGFSSEQAEHGVASTGL